MDDLREVIARAVHWDRTAFDEHTWTDKDLTDWGDGALKATVDGEVDFTAIADAALAAIKQAGFVVVPAEPTEAMAAAYEARVDASAVEQCIPAEEAYRAMIEASNAPT